MFYCLSIFMSNNPMTIQMISLTRQMMLTKIPNAAVNPSAAIEITKPPSCTPSCMGRNPIRLANREVKAKMRMLCAYVKTIPVNPPPESTPNKSNINKISEACMIRERYSNSKL